MADLANWFPKPIKRIGDEPIIVSLMDTDFYKFTMGNVVFKKYRDVMVRYGLTNRTKGIHLADHISRETLTEQLDHIMTLGFNDSELAYLRGINVYQDRMFNEEYLVGLRGLKLPGYDLSIGSDGEFKLEFYGTWFETILWETLALSVLNELYNQSILKEMTAFEQQCVYAEGMRRLQEKINFLKTRPSITFTEFATRRRNSCFWQDYVIRTLQNELSREQFLGTSNTLAAMKYGLTPMGTIAHEMYMIMMGIKNGDILAAHNQVLEDWWGEYGKGLSVALADTWGTEFFLRHFSKEQAINWKGSRQDSGDPFWEGERWIRMYHEYGIDSREKLFLPSDGLTLPLMDKLTEHFSDRLIVSHGWGSNLGNDMGFPPLSIVIKAIWANGHPLVKLSNNPAKAIGPKDEIERVKLEADYVPGEAVQPTY